MCFRADVLRGHPWNAFSVNEDLEFGLQLLLAGHPARFAPEAEVLATMPANPDNALSQRSRWEGGRHPIIRKYTPLLLKRFLSTGSFCMLDTIVELVIPALVNLLVFTLIMGFASALLALFGAGGMLLFSGLWFTAFLLGLLHLAVGLRNPGADPSLRATLAHAPKYALWKMMLYARMAKEGQPKEWVRTTREGPRGG
jgi:cellulose synthase/poly-beta-1,6-N-acetylglucosamine synthase-like glycosyltransferase